MGLFERSDLNRFDKPSKRKDVRLIVIRSGEYAGDASNLAKWGLFSTGAI